MNRSDGADSNTYSVVAAKTTKATRTTTTTTSHAATGQHRDVFAGTTLGIPDVSTHVGSVVHAFESLAANSPPASLITAERPYELYSTNSVVQSVKSFDRSLGTSFLNPVTMRHSTASRQAKQSHRKAHAPQPSPTPPAPPAPPIRDQRGQRPISSTDDYRRSFSPSHGPIVAAADGEWYLQAPSSSTNTFIRRPPSSQDVSYRVQASRPASHHNTTATDTGLTHYGSSQYEDDPTLLRGTTVSQSFIKNISNHLHHRSKPGKASSRRNAPVADSSSATSNGFRRRDAPNSSDKHYSGGGSQLLALSRSSAKRQSFRPRTSHRAII